MSVLFDAVNLSHMSHHVATMTCSVAAEAAAKHFRHSTIGQRRVVRRLIEREFLFRAAMNTEGVLSCQKTSQRNDTASRIVLSRI